MNNVNKDRPMRPGWEPDERYVGCSERFVDVGVKLYELEEDDDCAAPYAVLGLRPSLSGKPGAVRWSVEITSGGAMPEVVEVAYGYTNDEPAAQLAAESACREFARALLREVGE